MSLLKVSVVVTVFLFISTVGGVMEAYIALPLQFPYQAFIEVFNSTDRIGDCSGAVLTSKFVISTFDCLWEGIKFRVRLGSLLPGSVLDLPDYDQITENLPYNYPEHSFDEKYPAVLKLEKEISFSLRVQPVLLPEPYNSSTDGESVPSNYNALAAGYGKATSKRLEYLKMVVEPISECRNHFAENLLRKSLCVRSEDIFGRARGSLCTEEGVPLVLEHNRTLIGMFGITSIACISGGPNLFIKIDRFVNWIQETMKAFGDERD